MKEVIRARIDGKIKKEAAAVLAEVGLPVSAAFRLMVIRIAAENRFPFEWRKPTPRPSHPLRQAQDRPPRKELRVDREDALILISAALVHDIIHRLVA